MSEDETKFFLEFLKYLESGYDNEIDEIVLLGDIFDNWIFPYDIVPPTLEELLQADKNIDVVSQLNKLTDKYTVFYVHGNHDMHATRTGLPMKFQNTGQFLLNSICWDQLRTSSAKNMIIKSVFSAIAIKAKSIETLGLCMTGYMQILDFGVDLLAVSYRLRKPQVGTKFVL